MPGSWNIDAGPPFSPVQPAAAGELADGLPPPPPRGELVGQVVPPPPPPAEPIAPPLVPGPVPLSLPETWFEARRRQVHFLVFAALPGGLTSLVVHLGLLIGLAIYALALPHLGDRVVSVEVVQSVEVTAEDMLEALAMEIPLLMDHVMEDLPEDTRLWDEAVHDDPDRLVDESLLNFPASRPDPGLDLFPDAELELGITTPRIRGGELATRLQRRRQALAYGATLESEDAVDLALRWLIKHQRSDGSWSFQHRSGDHHCRGCLCSGQGTNGAENGATGMVLLALLGAGHSPLVGEHRKAVADGLEYLISKQQKNGGLMDSGNMYSHGLASLALCEALAMTRYQDAERAGAEFQRLSLAAQNAIQFIEYAQHSAGGWRYQPNQPGDTSIVGWQLMALKSGYLAGLSVDAEVVRRTTKFLDAASEDVIGSCYGYTKGARRAKVTPALRATTPIGLLCRMYTGWKRDEPGMAAGVERLADATEANKGLYYYYYAMQVLHHYGGPSWHRWNLWARDYLVKQQQRRGREAGSWFFSGPHDNAGRLYCTAMAAMCLEVYYRYAPIYGDEAVATPSADAVLEDG